ncbi:hypothetical protein MIR68_006252 [Amoeboaphelidium protococcarum]|nr:hypothetical protein MIR68_006252 [Amoeboaphelidium protococcarum]
MKNLGTKLSMSSSKHPAHTHAIPHLIGSTNLDDFDKLLMQFMRIESDLRLVKPQKTHDQALLSQAKSCKVVCDNCKKSGHEKKNCRAKGGDKEGQYPKSTQQDANTNGQSQKANVAAEAAQSVEVANAVSHSVQSDLVAMFSKGLGEKSESPENACVVIQLLNGRNKFEWICDSGVSSHMTFLSFGCFMQ